MNTPKLIGTIALISMLSSCSSTTSNVNEIEKQDEEGMPTTLQEECEQSGSEDSLQCQLYHTDLPQDEKESQLGIMYFSGYETIPKDCEKSKYWLLKSAKANNPKSLNYLGAFYFLGCRTTMQLKNDLTVQTFELDYKTAEDYFLLAIKAGEDRHARANIAELYSEGGYGIEQDYDKAREWFTQAIKENPERAYDGLSNLYLKQEKYTQALPYLKKGAEAGSFNSQNNLGYFYDKGLGNLEIDKQKALKWYTKSAEQGYELAKNNLARLQAELDTQ